jgi:hypothetical protein
VKLINGSQAFNFWQNPPAKVVRKYYFFDIQNPEEVIEGKQKPRVIERGPYSYDEKVEKKNVQFFGDNLVQFSPVSTIYFNKNLSVGDQNDLITVLNLPLLVSKNKLAIIYICFF